MTTTSPGSPAGDGRRLGLRRVKPWWLVAPLLFAGVILLVVASSADPAAPRGIAPEPTTGEQAAGLRTAPPSQRPSPASPGPTTSGEPIPASPLLRPAPTPAAADPSSAGGGSRAGPVSSPLPRATNPLPAATTPSPTAASEAPAIAPFTIGGDVGGLQPGQWKTIRLRVTNPNPVALRVTRLTVLVSDGPGSSGCPSATNLRVAQSSVSASDPLLVPALSEEAILAAPRAPQLQLIDLPEVNQDSCRLARFVLTYDGSAQW